MRNRIIVIVALICLALPSLPVFAGIDEQIKDTKARLGELSLQEKQLQQQLTQVQKDYMDTLAQWQNLETQKQQGLQELQEKVVSDTNKKE